MTVNPVLYLFVNKGLKMDAGKVASQAAQAAVMAFRLTGENSNLTRLWDKGGGHKTIVLEGRDDTHMHTIEKYLKERYFLCTPIIDEGLTDIPSHSYTAIGCALVDKNEPHAAATFASFDLYRDGPSIYWVPAGGADGAVAPERKGWRPWGKETR